MFGRSFYLNRFLRFFVSENLSDAAVEECDVKYEKVGCFSDNPKNRALPKLILSDRDKINWQPERMGEIFKEVKLLNDTHTQDVIPYNKLC